MGKEGKREQERTGRDRLEKEVDRTENRRSQTWKKEDIVRRCTGSEMTTAEDVTLEIQLDT